MQWDFSEPNIEGVYVISVASKMLSMHPQTLRKYERVGLVRPSRTDGMLRLYSQDDIARLKLIKYLVDDLGLNGDSMEAQAFAYLAVRSMRGLPFTWNNTTGVKNPTSGGLLNFVLK